MTTIDPGTPLIEVLRNPAGHLVLKRLAPSVVDSHLLHTYHSRPVGLVLATEEGLDSELRRLILAELASIPAPASAAASVSVERDAIDPPAALPEQYEGADVAVASATMSHPARCERWGRLEIRVDGPRHGNPFLDVEVTATFSSGGSSSQVLGFYDGDGCYLVRFMPPSSGVWSFELRSNARSLDGLTGSFDVHVGDSPGPVRVADGFHFAYADGRRYLPIGTTSYAWTHQTDELQEQTLRSLAASPFTKVRMCVFPKSYTFNDNEPERFPFARTDDGWDAARFDPAYWAQLEHRIDQLDALGIEADLILFHAYDRWGFSTMDAATDDRYVRYTVARLASFRNVWWSLANEYDLLVKRTSDWERWAAILRRWDPAGHLMSIHNCMEIYDQSRPWISHVSMQRSDLYKTAENVTEWRELWGKPVVVDECAYEGDIDQGWGNISGPELTRRMWEGAVRGGYVGHGETYMDPDDVLWWAKGGTLHGSSPERIRFLATIIAESPDGVLRPEELEWDVPTASVPGEYYLYYFGFGRPSFRRFFHDPEIEWDVDVIDTWNMTVETLAAPRSGRFVVDLPSREYIAVRLRRHRPAEADLATVRGGGA